jgi:glucosamine--fructose-6-phosphate aminotransferase (isomerizing)
MVKELFLTGRGSSLAAARTGALIIKETARFPSEGLSSASFRHGPMEMALPDVMVLTYEGNGKTAHLNKQLVEDVAHFGGRAMYICENDAPGALHLPVYCDLLRPLLEILPAQMISLALASIQGIEPGVFERASKVTAVE